MYPKSRSDDAKSEYLRADLQNRYSGTLIVDMAAKISRMNMKTAMRSICSFAMFSKKYFIENIYINTVEMANASLLPSLITIGKKIKPHIIRILGLSLINAKIVNNVNKIEALAMTFIDEVLLVLF